MLMLSAVINAGAVRVTDPEYAALAAVERSCVAGIKDHLGINQPQLGSIDCREVVHNTGAHI
jgi:hypothetical protein